jgi:hypothetical protein
MFAEALAVDGGDGPVSAVENLVLHGGDEDLKIQRRAKQHGDVHASAKTPN